MFQFKPVLKWAGGKSKLISQLAEYIPAAFNNYHEPFLGGGALFFYLAPQLMSQNSRAYLSDLVEEIIKLYQVVKDDVDGLICTARQHVYDKEYYYKVRALDPSKMSDLERAARILYLNRTCFNGLYRVNKKGQFNVSFGDYKNPTIVDEDGLRAASEAFMCATLFQSDFEVVLQNAQYGDFVYLDPPYVPLSATSDFTQYTSEPFGAREQKRLKDVFDLLKKRGCYVMLSNSNSEFVKDLYQGHNIKMVSASRAINSNAKRRGPIKELVVLSHSDEELKAINREYNQCGGGVRYAIES